MTVGLVLSLALVAVGSSRDAAARGKDVGDTPSGSVILAGTRTDEVTTTSVPIANSEYVRGKTTVIVNAPADKVKEVVLDVRKHSEFMPNTTKSKLLGRKGTVREVYVEMAALAGAVKMWAKLNMTPQTQGDTEVVEMRMVEGNLKDMQAVWRIKKLDDKRTELTLESFLHPGLPIPTKVINKENVDGSAKAALAMRGRIEG